MVEFLILKKIGANAPKDVNCAVKLNYFNDFIKANGEIYSGAYSASNYEVLITNGINSDIISSGVLNFESNISKEYISGGYIVLFDVNKTAILYGEYGNVDFSIEQALKVIDSPKQVYNDYEIATENYYEGKNYETERVYNQVDYGDSQDKKKTDEKEENDGAILYENFFNPKENRNFYDGVREKLDQVISSHKKDEELIKILPNSEFCKILYDNDRYYSVGRIFEDSLVKYVCYAVKGDYGETPKELKKFCRFIPSSPFFPLSSGYYVIFQDAITGEIIEH